MLALGAQNCSNGARARAAGRPQLFQWFEAAPWRTELFECRARAALELFCAPERSLNPFERFGAPCRARARHWNKSVRQGAA